MAEVNVNYWAVLVAGVVYFVLGGLWYSPILFAKPWMAALGKTAEQIRQQGGAVGAYVISFIGSLISAFVLAMFVRMQAPASLQSGLTTGFFVWFGFVATTVAPPYFYEDRSKKIYLMYAGYTLVGFLLMGGLLSVWQ